MYINPEYVTFKQAEKLKEIGFNIWCEHKYTDFDGIIRLDKGVISDTFPYAPEQWQVVKWFRLKFGIWIEVSCHSSGFFYPKIEICSDEAWENDDLRTKRLKANRKLFEFKSPEEAYSAAIDLILTF